MLTKLVGKVQINTSSLRTKTKGGKEEKKSKKSQKFRGSYFAND